MSHWWTSQTTSTRTPSYWTTQPSSRISTSCMRCKQPKKASCTFVPSLHEPTKRSTSTICTSSPALNRQYDTCTQQWDIQQKIHGPLKAIRKGNYNSWPLTDTKKVRKYFPESEETQFGDMRGQRQGVWLTDMNNTSNCSRHTQQITREKEWHIHPHLQTQ